MKRRDRTALSPAHVHWVMDLGDIEIDEASSLTCWKTVSVNMF